ncbi:MAG: YcjF family protein [Synechococcus sp.]
MGSRSRLLLILAGSLVVLIVVGGVLQAIRTLLWDLSYFLPGWLLAPVLLLGLGLVIAVGVQLGWPTWKRLQQRRRLQQRGTSEALQAPRDRRGAAQLSLTNIERLLERLDDDISRTKLQQDKERFEAELERGDLVIVVFGTGSSGKTSLIRALLNEVVGEVGAAMGSTRTSTSYRLRLRGLDRGIQMVDTPGILEADLDGHAREEMARRQAARADLMVVVVDGDLRASEAAVMDTLLQLGKRMLLVLNKSDLRGVDERERLLEILRQRCGGRIGADDVMACSASPQSIPRSGRSPLQPRPDIQQLVQRLAAVLHADGEELIADNILLQCRQLDDRGRSLLRQQRIREAKRCVDRYTWIGAGVVAATPLPGVDLLGTAAVNAQMVVEIAAIHGIELGKDQAKTLAMSVGRTLATLGAVKGAMGVISAGLHLSVPTLLAGRAIQGITAGWLTRIAGASFIRYFQQDQSWGDGGIQAVVQEQFELNRREASLRRFLEMAVRQVVEPLRRDRSRQLPPRPEPREAGATSDHGHRAP